MTQVLNPQDATASSKIQHNTGGGWFTTTITQLISLINSSNTTTYVNKPATQTAAPANGDTVTVNDTGRDIFLILSPSADIAGCTVALPPGSGGNTSDKQRVMIFMSQTISTLTLTSSNASLSHSSLNFLSDNLFTELMYDSQTNTWYRVTV